MTSVHSLLPTIRNTSSRECSMKIHRPEHLRKESELLDIMIENRKACMGDAAITKVARPSFDELVAARRARHAWETPIENADAIVTGIRSEQAKLEQRMIRQQRHRELAKQHKAEGKPWGRPRKDSK